MLRKLLIALAALVVLAAGVAYYLWHQATALPEWYDPNAPGTAVASAEGGAPASAPQVDTEWVQSADGQGQEMKNFHLRTSKIKPGIRKAIKASRATYKDGHVEAGMVANLGDVSPDELSKGDQNFLNKASEAFPSLKERDVYIGVEGETVVKDGVVQLGPNSKVKIGNLSYSLPDAARRLGMDESKLRAELNAELARMGVREPGK